MFKGFYDAEADAIRLDVLDEAGNPLPNGGIVLEEIDPKEIDPEEIDLETVESR